ncbi:helix-turn-helix domain-containing protein [Gordonia polyisoprenivorans]|nr:helix-turn-helix domain-containing protein [Gordonia polyisoprenivorans]QTI66884.1 helix-turn-helix domain-containing protein [Gordonia polyisoprenivorans]
MAYWSTAELSLSDQSQFWAEVVCRAFTPLVPRRTRAHQSDSIAPDGMPGWVRTRPLSATNTAEISACTQLITHGAAEVRQSPEDVFFVNMQLAGTCYGEQEGNRCVVRPGSFAVFDTTRPYSLEFRESDRNLWRAISFRIPQSQWFQVTSALPLTSAEINGAVGAGAVVKSMMASLWNQQAHLSGSSVDALDHAFTEVLAGALGPDTTGIRHLSETVGGREYLVENARRYIRAVLSRGRVTAPEVARASCVSVRSLHRAFEESGTTFAEFVRTERVSAACRDLTNNPGRSMAEVAASWGFCDSSHMTRTFHATLGCTPTEYRARAGTCAPSRSRAIDTCA